MGGEVKMKSLAKLNDFVDFCIAHPDMSFWQALLNWSKYNYIFGSNQIREDDYSDLEDTFYIE